MLKRNLTMLIAVGLLGANVSFAAAGTGTFPPSTEDTLYRMLPAQEQYFKQREAANPNPTGTTGSPFPMSTEDQLYELLPAQARYLDQRAAILAQELAGQGTVVNITASTKYINAEHDGILVIKNDKGQSFTWKADTLGEAVIPLKAIAPQDFAAGQTRVFVRHPLAHTSGS